MTKIDASNLAFAKVQMAIRKMEPFIPDIEVADDATFGDVLLAIMKFYPKPPELKAHMLDLLNAVGELKAAS